MPAPVRRQLLAAVVVLICALAYAAPAVAASGGSVPVEPASPNAEAIVDAYYLVLVITGVIFALVEAALLLFVFRYRRRGRPRDAEAPQIHGHTRLELAWTVVPVLLLALIAGFVFWQLPEIKDVPEASAAGEPLEIQVEGRQFYWQFAYPDGTIGYDTLVVPAERVVELEVTAPEQDVIHSWWIPALAGKIDAIPGVTNRTWFQAKRPGVYEGQCAEFCGVQHASMLGEVLAVPAARFESELETISETQGEQMFAAVCSKCHNLEGPESIGPNLQGNSLLADREQLAQLVREGRGQMPAVGRGWTDEQVDALHEYVSRFGGGGGG
jgi:cytochrome c oxidase subunit II